MAASSAFFQSGAYAVVGASSTRTKFGNKVLRWYQDAGLKVTPINPKESEIEGLQVTKTLKELTNPTTTSISVITPPAVTLQVLKDAVELDIQHIWLQPGAEDAAVKEAIANDSTLSSRTIHSGPCILVLGHQLLSQAKKSNL
ncbi:uncharacterized protein L969DRAFT_103009 [Mixia osmundae IAM 14324]|uniref:CoA-binding domain-containing protein n=1 Tax=Mixia osmundae (strain CBS 9802 / IAM 14324 / JCM 22182 / KY 12970) TaxID=764103 RepID=G7E2R6_MIXOS|nr:uncharacterized protein L969DRAFT_103009 [Mixia osmundae IAM 14324]KEI40323.1 hypothetical protein L969DRAFT_103009 [Mixia osmundae IAM 14324]GAA97126.1 hypothetical protein E5Q_03801 [Mixia osmundae IAM 14324]